MKTEKKCQVDGNMTAMTLADNSDVWFLTDMASSYCKSFGNCKGVKTNSAAYVAIKRNLLNIIPPMSVSANGASAPSRFMCCVRNGTYMYRDETTAARL